jgi:hypothetical protein
LRQHFGYIDRKRVELARMAIGAASWCSPFSGMFGDAALCYMPRETAKVIKFPERRSDIAKLRAELEEMRTLIRTALTAGAKAGAMVLWYPQMTGETFPLRKVPATVSRQRQILCDAGVTVPPPSAIVLAMLRSR